MKKSIIIFLIFVFITYFIGVLDKLYKINNLFLFVTLNLILVLLSILQILNLKKKYPKIYFVNPPVVCTIFTFLIPFSLTNVVLIESISELIIMSDSLIKLYFLIINSLNLMWAGYWLTDYFRCKSICMKNILLKIQQHVVLKINNVNFNTIFILLLFSFSAFIIMNVLNIYGYNSNEISRDIYIHYRYLLHLAFNVSYVVLIILTLFLFQKKTTIKFKFFYLFFLGILLFFGVFSGFKSDIFFPFLTIFVIYYILKNKFSLKFFFLTIFFLYFSYQTIEYLRINIRDNQIKKSTSNFKDGFNIYKKYFNKAENPNDTKAYLKKNEDITIKIFSRLNNFKEGILILSIVDMNPELLKNSETPKFLNAILISPLTAIIPRIIWKDKPINSEGVWASNILFKDYTKKNNLLYFPIAGSTSMSSFLYLYFAGGIFLVFLFYFLLGIFQNILFNLFNPGKFFAPTLIFLILLPRISLVDSAIYGIISFFFREFIILLIMQYLIFKKKK